MYLLYTVSVRGRHDYYYYFYIYFFSIRFWEPIGQHIYVSSPIKL